MIKSVVHSLDGILESLRNHIEEISEGKEDAECFKNKERNALINLYYNIQTVEEMYHRQSE